jgi:hypothetical protein
MAVIKCETCQGTGWVMQRQSYTLDPNWCGNQELNFREFPIRCHDCGGSGCKWKDDVITYE